MVITFDGSAGDGIGSDGKGSYTTGVINVGSGSYDLTLNLLTGANGNQAKRKLTFGFGYPVDYPDNYGDKPAWIPNAVTVPAFMNVRRLGTIQDQNTYLTWVAFQFDGPDHDGYRLRFVPLANSMGLTGPYLPADANYPYGTSPVSVTFQQGGGPSAFGRWVVSGRVVSADGFLQLGTLHTDVHRGQYEMPFGMTVDAQAPLPDPSVCPAGPANP